MTDNGVHPVWQARLDSGEFVSNEAIRAAFERSGLTSGEVAATLGWFKPDGQRVRVALGLKRTNGRPAGDEGRQLWIKYENAVEIAKALNVDPAEVGL